ncbi:hypothetical protein FACS1894187_04910 [Synergistales bacterium]|nr:hypothetical protein FACS1894187_04910 [Synergistales bacterium]
MNKAIFVLLCVIALLLGSLTYVWVYQPIVAAVEEKQTDKLMSDMKDSVETITARIETRDAKIKTEVVAIHETVRTKINALPADAVADGLNAELAMFRGMETRPGGLDGD